MRPATFVEVRLCGFAPESRAGFFGVKNCENGAVIFEVILGLFYQCIDKSMYTILQTRTWQFKCNSFHLAKGNGSLIGLAGIAESECRHKHFVTIEISICCWQHLRFYTQKVLGYWYIWKVANFAIEHKGDIFPWWSDFVIGIKWLSINNLPTNFVQNKEHCRGSALNFQ